MILRGKLANVLLALMKKTKWEASKTSLLKEN